MSIDLPESDWKLFRELRELALERLCKRALDGLQPRIEDRSRTYYDRYLDIFQFLKERDREVARAFDDPKRSQMIHQLAAMQDLGLLESEELSRFSTRTREKLQALAV
jgi:hypothetical protein